LPTFRYVLLNFEHIWIKFQCFYCIVRIVYICNTESCITFYTRTILF